MGKIWIIFYNTCETGHIESSVLLSLSASCCLCGCLYSRIYCLSNLLDLGSHCMFYCSVYLHSAQYLHVLQDSKHYLTELTAQVQPNSQVTDRPLFEIQRFKDDHLSMSLEFLYLPLG